MLAIRGLCGTALKYDPYCHILSYKTYLEDCTRVTTPSLLA